MGVHVTQLRRLVEAHMELTKFRLSSLVVFTTATGFALAQPNLHWPLLAWTTLGTFLAAAGAMALNEWQEVERDAMMERCAHRPLVTGSFPKVYGLVFGVSVACTGLALLATKANLLTAFLGLSVVLLYVLVYTPLKTRTPLCTLVGAICGALPPMMGWAAAAGSLGFGAFLLAVLLFFWQIPHFLSLAWVHRKEYRAGGFRMLPEVDEAGVLTARYSMMYALGTVATTFAFVAARLAGMTFAAAATFLGFTLLYPAYRLFSCPDGTWARKLFLATLAYLPLLMAFLLMDRQAPAPVVQAWNQQLQPSAFEVPLGDR